MGAASDILAKYQHAVSDLTLIMGEKGIFDVKVDGEMLYSKHEVGRHAEPGEVLGLFEEAYAADIRPYGT